MGPLLLSGVLAIATASAGLATCPSGSSWIRFPEDCGAGDTLGTAVSAVSDGGTVDVASGTYTFGSSGLNLSGLNKSVTLSARSLRGVTFSGGGTSPLVKVVNSTSNGKPLVFEGIVFSNGYSGSANRSGGVTLTNAEATFADCAFTNNRMVESSTGGGALGLYGGSRAILVRTTFTGNQAKNQGGAIYAVRNAGDGPSSVWVYDGTFTNNTTAGSGFTATSAGGAIYLRNAKLWVADTRFAGNVAGWVGGAIYGWGDWGSKSPYCSYDSAPSTDILISRSVFDSNRADDTANPGVQTAPTFGGAIHTENCVRTRIYGSSFDSNEAEWGGAISADHTELLLSQSVFRYNRVTATSSSLPVGGTLWSYAGDVSGSPDYPNGSVTINRTLVEGGTSADSGAANAQVGGCLFLQGDSSKAIPVPASARVSVTVADSAFVHCNAGSLSSASPGVRGGAMATNRVKLDVTNTLFVQNRAGGTTGSTSNYGLGAAIALLYDSIGTFHANVVMTDSFASEALAHPNYVDLWVDSSATVGSPEEWTESPPSVAGMVVAAPSQPAGAGGPYVGESDVVWAYAGSSATLDGSGVGTHPKSGVKNETSGNHTLAVSGLSNCSRCTTSTQAPTEPSTTLTATPSSLAPGQSTTLSWSTPDGSYLASVVDRGLGETGATGSRSVTPGGTQAFRRIAITQQGGTLAEPLVVVGGAGGGGQLIMANGFENNLNGWTLVVQ